MTTATEYISVKDTAKHLRVALKAAHPGVKFSVVSSSYAGSATIRVAWVDGPLETTVDLTSKAFEGAKMSNDAKDYVIKMVDGRPVCWGSDFVFTYRHESPEYVQERVAEVSEAPDAVHDFGGQCPTCGAWAAYAAAWWRARVFDSGRDLCCSRDCAGKLRARKLARA